LTCPVTRVVILIAVGAVWLAPVARAATARVAEGLLAEVVATGIVRPIQIAFDDDRLVVLSHGRATHAAAEVVWVDLKSSAPVDAAPLPRVVIPFSDGRTIVFGSLAVDGRSGALYLGEENGNRVYRLTRDQRLAPVAIGLHHLVGGSGMALDARGRLVVLDFVSPETQLRSESPPPSSLEADDGYQGPLVFRVELEASASLPRRLDLVPPLFPRNWARPHGEPLGRFMSITALPDDRLAVLDSLGEVFVFDANGTKHRLARLPAGHYHRTSMAVAPDGSVLVSSGFHIRRIYRITMAGAISVVASELGDPNGIAVDREGRVYVAETAFHRIIRIRPR
jgi:hypothetical protein